MALNAKPTVKSEDEINRLLLNITACQCLEIIVRIIRKIIIAEGVAERSPGHPLPSLGSVGGNGVNPYRLGFGVPEGHIQPAEQVQSSLCPGPAVTFNLVPNGRCCTAREL